MVCSGLNYRRLDGNLVVMVIAVVGAVFSTGRSFGRVHQSFMSHQQVTVKRQYKQLGVGQWGRGSTRSKGGGIR